MKRSEIIECACRVLYPFMLLFGFYIILLGDISPGGGFQGGVVLATARLSMLFIADDHTEEIKLLTKLEKYLFMLIVAVAILSVITRGAPFTNFIPPGTTFVSRRIFLMILNLLIGLKVSSGLVLIFNLFVKEGS